MTATVTIKGLDRVLKKLTSLEDLKAIKPGMKAAALHIKGKIAQYPPSSEANRPGQKRWYERGFGPRWPGGGKRTSETLGKKWTIAERDGGLTQVVGNKVSYGIYVQSEEHQAWFHKKRGWKTDRQVADEEQKTVVEFLAKEVEKVLNKK